MEREKLRLFWLLILSQSLFEPLKCQLATQGAFFTTKKSGKPDSPQIDELTLQREFFHCGKNAKCSNIVMSAVDEKTEKTEAKWENKWTTNQQGAMWTKVPEAGVILISKGKGTKQSTTYYDRVSSCAVDGNRNDILSQGSCSHTNTNDSLPWWRVDIGRRAMINNVMITNRGDCCPKRLRNFTIRVGFEDKKNLNPACKENVGITTGITVDFNCDRSLAGQFVYIESAFEFLTLCEVEVYGYYF